VSGTNTVPPGYESFEVRGARAVAQSALVSVVREVLTAATLHRWASTQHDATPLLGRAIAWATALPNGVSVVVRHTQHGGALAALTGDLFLAPTRAPAELAAAVRLANAGVPTPEVVAYAIYPAFGPFVRADVATRTLVGVDFAAAWGDSSGDVPRRQMLIGAVAVLLRALRGAGAVHPDLNLKNVFIVESGAQSTAFVLDIDRVTFVAPGDNRAFILNVERFIRSAEKWRRERGLDLDPQAFGRALALAMNAQADRSAV
jgi:hypothetical protein